MEFVLDAVEARILGVLLEKQMTTPDYYPLTLNALINGCNQKSNREPVMNLDSSSVEEALRRLRNKHLVWQVRTHGSRAAKYEHNMQQAVAGFSQKELALLCILLLRGPQTPGELKMRTSRMYEFHGLAALEHSLNKLISHEQGPFVAKLERQPGHKENRYAHLFCGAPQVEPVHETGSEAGQDQSKAPGVSGLNDRVGVVEQKVRDLEAELEALKKSFIEFKGQFE